MTKIPNTKHVFKKFEFGIWNLFRISDFGFRIYSAGFTMIEVVVTLGIITAISSVVLFSFSGLNENGSLNRSARELALNIRRAQNMALAVTQIPGVPQSPPAIGVQLSVGQTKYLTFADMVRDNKFSAVGDAKIGEDKNFEKGVRADSIKVDSVSYNTIHIIFAAPEANITISNESGVSVGDKAEIKLTPPSGKISKTLFVSVSGQINIK